MTPKSEEIRRRLLALRDEGYAAFQAKLMPGIPAHRVIGVRTPQLRALAKELAAHPDIEDFLSDLPHGYYDEYNLHGFLISRERDYAAAVRRVDALLPYVDNWATCDLLRPAAFRRNRALLAADIDRWLTSDRVYTVRFGLEMLMAHFLDEDFTPGVLDKAAALCGGEYYVNMMIAWLFATALAKQWEATLPYVRQRRLSPWVHGKTIQKAIESYRITDQQKQLLQTLRLPRGGQ